MVSESEPGSEDKPKEKPDEAQTVSAEDLKKLQRSLGREADKAKAEAAAAGQRVKELEGRAAELEAKLSRYQQEELLGDLDAIRDDQQALYERAKQLTEAYQKVNQALSEQSKRGLDFALRAAAAELAVGEGESRERMGEYLERLHGAKTEADIYRIMGDIRVENERRLREEMAARASSEKTGKPEVDEGGGAPSIKSLLDEMAKYDLTTEEGRTRWAQDRERIRARIGRK